MVALHMDAVAPQSAFADIIDFTVVSNVNRLALGTIVPGKFIRCIFLHNLLRNFREAISKNGFWFKVEADARFHAKPDDASILIFKGTPQTGGILQYFEDLNRAPNKEIEPKDFFEIASNTKSST
jgi:hypothetical protein